MKIHVLGLGNSLLKSISTIKSDEMTIGVNNIFDYYPVDHVVVLDNPEIFNQMKLQTIINCRPESFHSQIEWYENHQKERFKLFPLGTRRMLSLFDSSNEIPSGYDSPFAACGLAYRMGAKEIIVHGVDLTNHPHLGNIIPIVVKSYWDLKNFFADKGVRLCCVDRNVPLSEVLPGI